MRNPFGQLPFSRFRKVSAWAGLATVILAIFAGLSTFSILTGLTPIKPTREVVTWLLLANFVLVAAMLAMVLWQIWHLIAAKRQGEPGAGLHVRLVSLFSLVAALPAIIVAAFAAVTLNRGLDAWFSERTRAIVDTSVSVAESYIKDSGEATRGDAAAIANDLNQQKELFDTDRQAFVKRVGRHAALRGLVGVFVFDLSIKRVEANVTINDKVQFRAPPQSAIEKADSGELVIIPPAQGSNVVRALLKLSSFPSHYLYLYRTISPSAIEQLAKTRAGKAEYDQMMAQRTGLQITFALMYAGVSFIFLLAAIWLAMWLADRLVAPVVKLLDAARRVSDGDLDTKVEGIAGTDELARLGSTFNRMTGELKQQRNELVATNQISEERRRFTEAVLSGVSSGIIGLEPDGRISLVNRAAASLLGQSERQLRGKTLEEAIPSFAPILEQAGHRPAGWAEGNVSFRVGGRERSFMARVTTEKSEGEAEGHVVTFDDITDLVAAQRNSAWADIARRIAHEIKNPLTPIQLSAERLRRKYSREIQTDKQVFEQCTETIIRQVGDIGRMVDEFSSFARMPSAVLEPNDLVSVVKEATLLQRVSSSDLTIDLKLPEGDMAFLFDRRLLTQAITNLVKNAREAIEQRLQTSGGPPGHILVEAGFDGNVPYVRVTDNGVGLPSENRDRLTEPYMTTREKGTGLGLAIVKRIMEEHRGALTLEDAPKDFADGLGARIELRFAPQEEPARLPEPA
jgi:two-component system nitrogen regulation sensor histidine kinase NtrY